MNLKEDIKLSYEDSNQDIKDLTLKFRVPSASVKVRLDELQELYVNEMQDYANELEKLQSKAQGETEEDKVTNMFSDKKAVALVTKIQGKINEAGIRNYIEKFKVIVNTKNLTTDKKELFNQEVTQDFWQSVNTVQVKEAVDFFMSLY